MIENLHIITKSDLGVQNNSWQKQLAHAFTEPEDLLHFLQIKDYPLPQLKNDFAFLVPRYFASLMQKNNPKDPLFLQVMPQDTENLRHPEFFLDPVDDTNNSILPGLIQKYTNRCLLIAAPSCAVNCRYCFRRNFPYKNNFLTNEQIQLALDYIQSQSNINEVILSGGEPLMLKNAKLDIINQNLEKIAHIKRLRIHSRMPVVLPDRIDVGFLDWIEKSQLKIIVVLHINHANEVSSELKNKVALLKRHGVLVLNQSVLLKGVNDRAQILVDLSEALFDADIQPYYLNLLDKVAGSQHFYVDDSTAVQIYSDAAKKLSGFMLPKLVRDMGNNNYKQIIAPLVL